jgi:hypothetical protein
MKTIVEGVIIELTEDQERYVKAKRKEKQKYWKNFKLMLLSFGFKKMKEFKNCYSLEKPSCFAEIQDRGTYFSLWMIGEHFKSTDSIPGGWVYSDPKEAAEEIEKAKIKSLEN